MPLARKRRKQTAITTGQRLIPPKEGAIVRMYRIGHGDCFLLAFPGKTEAKPVYVLIDCGYKPGSPAYIQPVAAKRTKDICEDIRAVTGGHIDIAIITHEHQDHVNNISEANFANMTIGESWFAWTEDPDDDLANDLRKKFKDKLIGLVAARNRLAAAGDTKQVKTIDELLAFELGGEDEVFNVARATTMLGAAGVSMNKRSMKVFKDLSTNGVKFLRPHKSILTIPGAKDVRIFVLGPPYNEDQLKDLNPQGTEEFHRVAMASAGNYFAAAAQAAAKGGHCESPFASRYCIEQKKVFADREDGKFFTQVYGKKGKPDSPPRGVATPGPNEAIGNPEWRRIDNDWLYSAEQLALAMNDFTNNASVVLAFELGKGGKVLLFAADAQRGNWVSWRKGNWKDGDTTVTTKDLLSRAVLYKVGHHGSHNATLNGLASDENPNLGWMATGQYAGEFTAMITAVREWAVKEAGWDHPLKTIKDALLKKASGRVFQTDTDFSKMAMTDGSSTADWNNFKSRVTSNSLFFDYQILF